MIGYMKQNLQLTYQFSSNPPSGTLKIRYQLTYGNHLFCSVSLYAPTFIKVSRH